MLHGRGPFADGINDAAIAALSSEKRLFLSVTHCRTGRNALFANFDTAAELQRCVLASAAIPKSLHPFDLLRSTPPTYPEAGGIIVDPKCEHDGTKIRLAICDVCDEGWHIGCLDPPLKSWPGKGFRCPKCVKCSSCGANHAEAKDHAWAPGYRMCKSCDTLFKSKKYCPVCNVVHGKGENEMVECDSCKFWVHARCDGLGKEELDELQSSDKEYTCPNCRGERTTTLMLQLLVTLSQEDREKFFAEPVTVECQGDVTPEFQNVLDAIPSEQARDIASNALVVGKKVMLEYELTGVAITVSERDGSKHVSRLKWG